MLAEKHVLDNGGEILSPDPAVGSFRADDGSSPVTGHAVSAGRGGQCLSSQRPNAAGPGTAQIWTARVLPVALSPGRDRLVLYIAVTWLAKAPAAEHLAMTLGEPALQPQGFARTAFMPFDSLRPLAAAALGP